VQLDTKEVRPTRGVVLKHFSARDMVSRWDVLEVHERATSLAAARFLDTLVNRLPFPIAARRWMAAANSLPNSRSLASNETCRSSSSHRARPSSTDRSNALIARIMRSSIK
jgi:hypothetical protein